MPEMFNRAKVRDVKLGYVGVCYGIGLRQGMLKRAKFRKA